MKKTLFVRQIALAFAALCLLGASSLAAATYLVNSTDDLPDADPLDGVCSAAGTGTCTLRAAIMEANAAPGSDAIVVPAGVYLITRAFYDDSAIGGDFDITGPVTIVGAESGATIVDGNGDVTSDRVFHILPDAGSVTLKGMTVRHGKALVSGSGFSGGGIYALNRNLTLTDLRIEENTAKNGGGLYIVGNVGGTVVLSNATVRNNTATNLRGGGIAVDGVVGSLTNVVLTGNSAPIGHGGGLSADFSDLTMTDCLIFANTATYGGGVAGSGTLTRKLVHCEIFSNAAAVAGGGVDNDHGSFNLTECHVHDNHATDGGGINNIGNLVLLRTLIEGNSASMSGGGLRIPDSDLVQDAILIDSTTLSRNTARFGGAIYYSQIQDLNSAHMLTLRNSTLFGNQVSRDGAGIYAQGMTRVYTSSVTIASNVLLRTTGLNPMRGGGVFLADTAYVFADNTVVADNYFANAVTPDTHPDDIFTAPNAFFSLQNGFNFIETIANVNFTGTTAHCIFNQDPMFDPAGLAYHGGATPTLAMMAGSPLIDAGNSAIAPPADQRGFVRVGIAEIGAFEASDMAPLAVLQSVVSRKAHGNAGDCDIGLTVTGPPTVECRSGGANGNHTVIFTFANQLASVDSATITQGTGVVSSSGIGADAHQYVVSLSGVSNAQRLLVTLNNVRDSYAYRSPIVNASMAVLLGDTSGNGSVSATDISQTKLRSGETVGSANFRSDVNASGSISATDVSQVKAQSGTALP